MDSPGAYPESPVDQDDVVYPCKGCGEILEEGKAFELAGNRWHIDCFRCNTCGTLLDSDANLLLLGDGSLICNNCTYSCNHCGNKIEDLAILTGDQAFCANCFRCRNCKRKIENLRYARTSQGIFCMTCHESLMARRRKKNKKPPPTGPAPKVDKSLPALPPNAAQAAPSFTPDLDTPSEVFSEPPTADASPHTQHSRRNDSSPADFRRDASPASVDDGSGRNLTLPASIYKESHQSEASEVGDDNGILLPFALDPNTAPGPSPLGKTANRVAEGAGSREYFNRQGGGHRDVLKENRSRSASAERQKQSPHIAYQEKGRQQSEQVVDTYRRRNEPAIDGATAAIDRTPGQHPAPVPSHASDEFKLQEVPKSKRAEARKESVARSPSHRGSTAEPAQSGANTANSPSSASPSLAQPQLGRDVSPEKPGSSYASNTRVERPARGDSLANSALKSNGVVLEAEKPGTLPTTPTASQHERKHSSATPRAQQNGIDQAASPLPSSAAKLSADPPPPPQRSAGRPAPPPSSDHYAPSRGVPQGFPQHQSHRATDSTSTLQSETHNGASVPAGLLRYSAQGDFSQDEDFVRLLSGQEGQEKEGSVLRRVSNAMSKHGRSFSDRGSISRGHKKWPTNGSIDISSPTAPSPESREEAVNLRNELRRAQQRIAELEAEKNGLQETVHSAADIKQANTMLREKRNTIAVLDTQREMIIRELEIMTDHLKQAKANGGAVDINLLKSEITKDFATSLEKLKDQLGGQIEDLITRRSALTDEISNLIQMKDKGFQEYESLSAQNKKLSDMNQNLIENIQGTLKSNKQQQGQQIGDAVRSPANGLGIYHTHHRGGKSDLSIDGQTIMHESSYPNLHETEGEATLAQPQVVNIRKGGKPTKFSNWKKGGQAITKNVTKGFKGAFGPSDKREDEYNVKVIGTPYGSTHHQPDFASMSSSLKSREETQQPTPRGWFGGKTATGRPLNDKFKQTQGNGSSSNLDGGDGSVLFGTDLSVRCDFEKRMIPAIVSRCIEEVESRGMEAEGVYRKSGGNSQVTQVKQGFEINNEYDISDPDLDIHAVTSALKNYFHRLPVPLIPFAIYEQFLEAGGSEDSGQKARLMHETLQQMPRAHYDTLQFLVFHLSRVYQHAEDNLMTPLNLAVVFAPTILRPHDPNREFTDMTAQRVAVQALLENHKNIFFEDET